MTCLVSLHAIATGQSAGNSCHGRSSTCYKFRIETLARVCNENLNGHEASRPCGKCLIDNGDIEHKGGIDIFDVNTSLGPALLLDRSRPFPWTTSKILLSSVPVIHASQFLRAQLALSPIMVVTNARGRSLGF